MAKAKIQSDRQSEPCTEEQIFKLLVMARQGEIIEVPFGADIYDYADGVVDWINENPALKFKIQELSDLTKGQIGMCFTELE